MKIWSGFLSLSLMIAAFQPPAPGQDPSGRRLESSAERATGTLAVIRPNTLEQRWRFDLVRGSGSRYQLLLFAASDPATVQRALWIEGSGDVLLWDGARSGYGPAETLSDGLDLALGPDAASGFPWLLPGDPAAADIAVPGVRTQHWVDSDSGRLQRIEVEIDSPETVIASAMSPDGAEVSGAEPPSRFLLEIDSWDSASSVDGTPLFTPPGNSTFVAQWRPGDLSLATHLDTDTDSDPSTRPQFGEAIEVSIASLVTRVVDSHGEPVLGLGPDDFRVRLGRQEATILAVDWVDQSKPNVAPLSPDRNSDIPQLSARPTSAAPLILFFTQAGLDKSYTTGALRFHQVVDELIAGLPPGSLIGVVAFDSQLRLRQDFTDDHRRVTEALERSIRFGGLGTERRQPPPSLAATLDFRAARDAASPEVGLRLAAEALGRLPGEKTMIYLGWGLGTFSREGVRMTADYEPARLALRQANTTVFVLDTTDADFHSLEVGLQRVASDTGGTYEKTNQFPRRAAARLSRTLGGYYLIAVDRSGLNSHRKEWRVELRDRPGTVLVAPTPR